MMITFANLMVQTQINILGVNSMAAYASYTKAEGFLYLPQWSDRPGQHHFRGTEPRGREHGTDEERDTDSHFYGDRDYDRDQYRYFGLSGAGISSVPSNDPEIIRLSAQKIGCTTFGLYFLYGIVEVTAGAIRGSDTVRLPWPF